LKHLIWRGNSGKSAGRGTTPWPADAFSRRCRLRRRLFHRQLTNKGRRSDADRLEYGAGAAHRSGAQEEALAGLLDGDLLEAVEIAHDVAPFRIGAGGGKSLVELLAQDEGKEGAERMSPTLR